METDYLFSSNWTRRLVLNRVRLFLNCFVFILFDWVSNEYLNGIGYVL